LTFDRIKPPKASIGYWNALDVLMEGCQIIDFDFRYVYVNKVAAVQGQKTREEMLGIISWTSIRILNKTKYFLTFRNV
jgi:hypothetical protein